MLHAVCQAFNEGDLLLVEAGTGTGKSLAYLLPAIHFAAANSRRSSSRPTPSTSRSSSTKRTSPSCGRFSKTRSLSESPSSRPGNYLCRRRLDTCAGARFERGRSPHPGQDPGLAPDDATGDVAELAMTPPDWDVWARLRAIAKAASRIHAHTLAASASFSGAYASRGSHIIIVNHALLLSDLVLETGAARAQAPDRRRGPSPRSPGDRAARLRGGPAWRGHACEP